MSLGARKCLVVSLLIGILVISNILLIAQWLSDHGVVALAHRIRSEYVTGTTLTLIVVLLLLLVNPKTGTSRWLRRCPVCDHHLISRGSYCSECGSKVAS